ncbi:TonB-dependent receptor [Aliidiomarina minuta]|uniref:TonB-dependent receptor n=1 Tax=Aliidiomarina minuta TaxID=880057 RepID=A0A432WA37_9GAMM|nr:TonB-dependent receptor [Aliidiomarina minuta]RUO26895.1 TonB-dependent receptor [Aliidiomarina minuta]
MRSYTNLTFAIAALLSAPVLNASDEPAEEPVLANTESSHPLETITVRASGLGRNAVEMAGPVSVLSGDELTQRAEASIGETLKYEPGVHGNYFGPVASSPVIRGLDGPRVQVVRNGMSTGDVSREGPDHAITADAMTAQQIEVLRGPATLLYGSGAIGGVINVVDNRIPRTASGRPDTLLQGKFNTAATERALSFSHDTSGDNLAFHADGHYRKSNDYRVPRYSNDEGYSTSRLDNSWAEHHTLNFGSSHIADWGFVGFSYGYMDSSYGLPEGPASPDDEDEGELIKLNQQRVALAAEYQPGHQSWELLTADLAFTDYDHAEYDEGVPETEFTSKAWEMRLTGIYLLDNGWRGVIGYHGTTRDYEAAGEEAFTPNTDTDSHALFLLQERHFGSLKFEAGARFERLTHKASDVEDASGIRDIDDPFNLFSWSIGGVYSLNQNHRLTAAFSQAERAPIANELYANGVHVGTRSYEIGTAYQVTHENGQTTIVSDPSLSSVERANNLDLGLRGNFGDLSYQLNLFYNQIDDFAYLRNLGMQIATMDAYQYTQRDATLRGAEAEVSWQFMPAQQLSLMADTVRARLDEGGNLPRIPPHRLGAEYQYQANQWVATVGVSRYGRQSDVAENEEVTQGYTLLEASINYDFNWQNQNMMWFAKLQNASNRLAFVHSSFIKEEAPLPGRNLTIGLQARF